MQISYYRIQFDAASNEKKQMEPKKELGRPWPEKKLLINSMWVRS